MDEKKRFRYRHYDDDFKRNAVDLLRTSTKTIAEVACDLGIPYKTLESWHLQMGSGPRKPLPTRTRRSWRAFGVSLRRLRWSATS